MRTLLALLFSLALASSSPLLAAPDDLTETFDSPDGRFALKVEAPDKEAEEAKLAIVEKASGKVVGDLGTDYASILSRIKVVWSPDSKRVAYRGAGEKDWSTSVYVWDGSAFRHVPLPENLPSPDIKFRKSDEQGGVKNYGGGVEPVRWLKSGDLELVSEETQMARESSRTYTGSITIIVRFDKEQRASIRSATKSKTRVE